MRIRVKLKPSQKGTKQLMAKYGDALVCVRYRYDEEKRKQIKTVEIIVSEREWTPPPPRYSHDDMVPLRIGYTEKALQEQARSAGGCWDRGRKLWFVRYGSIAGTRLEKYIVL